MSLMDLKRKGGQCSEQRRWGVGELGVGWGSQGWGGAQGRDEGPAGKGPGPGSTCSSTDIARQVFTRNTVSVGHASLLLPLVSSQISSSQRCLSDHSIMSESCMDVRAEL